MAFCDYCNDEGFEVEPSFLFTHARTELGDWICHYCYLIGCCIEWQRVCGETIDPCPFMDCGHRPKLVGPFVPLKVQPCPATPPP